MKDLKYGDKLIRMEGVIVEVHDGAVAIDLKGRLGHLRVPMRMLISDRPVAVGQETAWNMSFVEQLGLEDREEKKEEKGGARDELDIGEGNAVRDLCPDYPAARMGAGKQRTEGYDSRPCDCGGRPSQETGAL